MSVSHDYLGRCINIFAWCVGSCVYGSMVCVVQVSCVCMCAYMLLCVVGVVACVCLWLYYLCVLSACVCVCVSVCSLVLVFSLCEDVAHVADVSA